MSSKKDKRVTIYDIAQQTGIAPSSVSKALNDQPSVSKRIRELVKSKARELNYIHNTNAANLRRGTSKTIGVIVPKINTTFFADVIAGIEETCYENNHHLIICQTDESFEKESIAVETLIHQNVDCIFISLSMETKSTHHLLNINNHHIQLVQFDRVDYSIPCHTIVNDNENAAYEATKHLIMMGYMKIAMLTGFDHLSIYNDRKEGYLKAIREAELFIPYDYVVEKVLSTEKGMQVALSLLESKNPPDAFFSTSDYAALGALKACQSKGLHVPEQVGIVGFSNEAFSELITPSLTSINQSSRQLGKDTANIYFHEILELKNESEYRSHLVKCSLIIRESSFRKNRK